MNSTSTDSHSHLMRMGQALCLGGAALGAIGLIGWLTGAQALVTIVPGQPPMMPNTAFALLLLGTAGAMRGSTSFASMARSLSVLMAVVVLLIGLVTLVEYAPGLPFSIDQLLSTDQLAVRIEAGPYPGRPSPPTALAVTLLATALLLWNWRPAARIVPAEWLILFAGLIAFTALLGQAFGAGALYRLIRTPIIGVAVHTALSLLLISVGLLLHRPGSRVARLASSPNPGEIMLRQLALAFILISVSIGFAGGLLFEILGSENAALIAASLTVIGIVAGLSLLAITARQLNRAHEALGLSQARSRELVELASDGIFIADLDGRYVDVNEAGCRMLGFSRDEILGKTILNLIPREDEARLRKDRERFLEGGTGVGEWMLRRKDGSYLPVEVSAKILPDRRWQAFVRDISERKRAEESLRESEERLRRVSDNAEVGLTRYTRDWCYVSANPAYAGIAGKPLDQIVGRPIAEVKGAEGAETIRPYVERVLRGEHVTFEVQVPFSSGGERYLHVSYTPDANAAGEIVGWVASITDITARKRAEQLLARDLDAMTRLRRLGILSAQADNLEPVLTEIVDTAIAISDADFGNIQLLDPASGDLRIAAQRGFPSWWLEFWNSVAKGKGACGTALARGERVIVEDVEESAVFAGTPAVDIQRKAGVRAVQSAPLVSRSGRTMGMLSTHFRKPHRPDDRVLRLLDLLAGQAADIIEHAQAEEALRLSEAKFSGIVSVSADAIVAVDEDYRITLFNESAEQVFGRSKADVIGAPLDILVPQRLRAAHASHIKGFEAGSESTRRLAERHTEVFGLRSNGEEFPADASISKIVVGGKRYLTVVLRDISERKRIESEQRLLAELGSLLAESLDFEERLTDVGRLLARDLADLCIVDVIEDDGSMRRARVACRDANKAWLSDVLMGQPPSGMPSDMARPELEKAVIIRKVTPDVIGSWARGQQDRAALEAAGIQSAIVVPLLARGKALGIVSLLSSSRPFHDTDLRIVEAVTQRVALVLDNARLFAAARRAIRARDDMLGIVAHDLRNPLAAISTLAAVLQMKAPEREIGNEIASAAGRMNRLIRDLVDATLLEAGTFVIKQERVPAGEVLSEVLESQTRLASSGSLELRIDAAPDLPELWADHDRLLQVFENLVGNAIKFSKPGGRITLGARAGAGEVLFSVADTGCGIESDQLPRVFDRFWQAPEAKRRGAGLGLPIVKGIVEAHGGRVWVQSSPGQGSTFFFAIPAAQASRHHSDTTLRVAS